MASTGRVSSWNESLLVAMIQYPVPVVKGPEDIQTQVDQICKAVATTKAVEDLAKGEYKLPWDSSIRVRDGWKYYPEGVKLGPMPKNGTTAAKPAESVTV